MATPRRRTGRTAPAAACVALAATCLALAWAPPAPAAQDPALTPLVQGFEDQAVLSGLDSPTAVRFAPPPDGRIFVASKGGRVSAYDGPGDTTPTTIVDLSTEVYDYWDRGLVGMALDPAFGAAGGWLYLLYTRDAAIGGAAPRWNDDCPGLPSGPDATANGCVASGRLVRVHVGQFGVDGPVVPLITDQWCQQFPSHSLGALTFGPDGMLYVGAGEAASFTQADYGQFGGGGGVPVNPCGDPREEGGALRAQDVRSAGDPTGLDGAILRVDPATGRGAPGNPFAGDEGARRIVAYGLRNPFRFAFRPGTRELWLGDVGWDTWEEVDRLADATDGHAENFGWPCFEGGARQPRFTALALPLCQSLAGQAVTPPVYAYPHQATGAEAPGCAHPLGASVSGVAFHGHDAYPVVYDGAMFISDYARACVMVMPAGADGAPDPSRIQDFAAGTGPAGPVDLQTGPDGALYYAELDPEVPERGSLRRIAFVPNRAPVARAAATPAEGPAPLAVRFSAAGSFDPDGDELAYAWDLDGDGRFDDASGPEAGRTYTRAVDVRAGVEVSDRHGARDHAFVDVSPGNTAPEVHIDAPAAALQWAVGDHIAFHGSGRDAQDGVLPAAALHWILTIEHCTVGSDTCHTHPLTALDGAAVGELIAPEHDYPSRLVLRLTAKDSRGVQGEDTVRLQPRPVRVTAAAGREGATVSLDGVSGARVERTVIAGALVTVATAPAQETPAGSLFLGGWSDGSGAASFGARPLADLSLTAHFGLGPRAVSPPTVTGRAAVGETLRAAPGAWTGDAPLSLITAWLRCDAAGGACAAAGEGPARRLEAADAGHVLRAQVRAANGAGPEVTAASAPTAVVEPLAPPAPPRTGGGPPALALRLSDPGRRRLSTVIALLARCDRPCRLTATASLRVAGRTRRLPRPLAAPASATRVRLKVRLPAPARRRARAALARRGAVRLRIAVTGTGTSIPRPSAHAARTVRIVGGR